jgi:hypothetical protein
MMATYKEVGSNTILNVERDIPLNKNHSITTSHDKLFVGCKPSGPPTPSAGVLNERYRPEAVTSVRDAKTFNRNGSRPSVHARPRLGNV